MTDVRLTQQLVEEWAGANPDVRATQVSLEMWASVDVPAVPSGDIRVMVLA